MINPGLSVQIIQQDFTPAEIIVQIERKFINVRESVTALGKATKEKMQELIQTKRITGSADDIKYGNLADSIDVYYWGNGVDFVAAGIGSINKLNERAPYWYIVNYGGSVTKSSGTYHFTPGYFQGNKFHYNPMQSDGFMLPDGLSSSAILPPLGYIESTRVWLASLVRILKISSTGEVRIS